MWIHFLALGILAGVAWQDTISRMIPGKLLLLLFGCGVANAWWSGAWCTAGLGLLVCGLPVLGVSLIPWGNEIGGGDVKLCAALGFLLGPAEGLMVILRAVFYLSVYGLLRRKQALPFAPFSFLAYITTLLIF